MKIKSELYPQVTYERWKTPVSDVIHYHLHLQGVLQTFYENHFFIIPHFGDKRRDHKKVFVMSTHRNTSFRIVSEGCALTCIDKYFRKKKTSKPKKSRRRKDSSTWKLWGTSLIRELDEGGELSQFVTPPDPTICEYLVQMADDWIEIVDCEPIWEVHKNITVEKLMAKFVKTKYVDIPRHKYKR